MTIPTFTTAGVLPPFLGSVMNPAAGMRSPYPTTLQELAGVFGTTPRRRAILRGLVKYRFALRQNGISTGFQWLDGSFVEDQPTPNDVDVVTFAVQPAITPALIDLFTPATTKANFMCDSYFVAVQAPPENVTFWTTYWFGLLSHRRVTSEWKGLVRVRVEDAANDLAAVALLDKLDGGP